ncbi:MAG TPA: hypothetical protein VGK73_39475, partial [Polyangiaceae bacterium]
LDDDMPFQRRRSKLPFIAAAAVIVLGGAGFAASKNIKAEPAPIPAPAAAPIEFQKTVTTPLPTSEPTPAPAAEKSETEKSEAKGGLTDEVKAKLLSADKERDAKKKSARGKTRGAPRAKSGGGSGVFRAGGDASDPLNSKL